MKASLASLINAILLIALSLWGYLGSDSPSLTALIPLLGGVGLLLCYPGVKKENKTIAHIAVLLTLIMALGLVKPLMGAFGRNDAAAIARVVIMLASSIVAMIYFIKSFIQARKNREAQ